MNLDEPMGIRVALERMKVRSHGRIGAQVHGTRGFSCSWLS